MTTSINNKKPAATVRDGSLKATVWQNDGERGPYFSVQITRTYKDEQGGYHDSDRFSRNDLLRVARLATMAYDEIAELTQSEEVYAATASSSPLAADDRHCASRLGIYASGCPFHRPF